MHIRHDELEVMNLHHILHLAHIPIPPKGSSVSANSYNSGNNYSNEKGDDAIQRNVKTNDSIEGDTSSIIKKLKSEIRALKSVLNSHNKQICSRCGWGWHLFDEVFKLHHESKD